MKVWKVTFDNELIASDEEYYIRDASLLNSFVEGDTVYVENVPMAEKFMTSWYGEDAVLVDMSEERVMEMFHPN